MRVHAIQTGTVMVKQAQLRSRGSVLHTILDKVWTEPLPIYAWAVEHPEGVLLVDTGETARTAEPGYFPWWHPYYRLGVQARVLPEQEVGPQLKSLGIDPTDVRWVVMTHLHTDHAGGLHHFPRAEVLVAEREYQAAAGIPGQLRGYLPHRWPAWLKPRRITFSHGPYGAFAASHRLTAAGDIRLVPTPGHSAGHLSVIVEEPGGPDLFLAGDTSYTEELMLAQAVDGVAPDQAAARDTLARILRQAAARPTVYLPAHDPQAGERLRLRQTVLREESVPRAGGGYA